MKIGILNDVLGVESHQVHELAGHIGFDGVELGIRSSEARTHALWQPESRARLRTAAEATGVATASLCLHGWGGLAAAPDSRPDGVAIAKEAIQFAAELGARVILVPLNAPSSMSYDEAASGWALALREAGPVAAAAGVTLAMESVGRTHTQSAERFQKLMAATQGIGVGIYYDIGNAIFQGFDPLGDMRSLGKLITRIHIKQPGKYLLPDGPINLVKVFEAMVDIGYDDYVVLETSGLDDPVASARANLQFLRTLGAGQAKAS